MSMQLLICEVAAHTSELWDKGACTNNNYNTV